MVPTDFHDFFVASAGAGAALLGLLFVAVSIAPEHTAQGVTASSAYLALLNAFFVSLVALLPRTNLGPAALVLSLLGLMYTLQSGWRSWRHATGRGFAGARGAAFVLIGLSLYGYELNVAIHLMHAPHVASAVSSLAGLLVGIYAFGLASAWQLLGGRRHEWSGRLFSESAVEDNQADSPAEQRLSRRRPIAARQNQDRNWPGRRVE